MQSIHKIAAKLNAGAYDKKLEYLYGRSERKVQWARERIIRVMEGYQAAFQKDDSTEVRIFSAPGRTEIGGNHTDHQRGKVLTGSVDLDALACAAYNGTKLIRIFSDGYGLTTVDIREMLPNQGEKNTTQAIVRGIAAKICEMGFPLSGFDAYVISDVPGGSGLSSSACFEVLLGTAINNLFCENQLDMAEIAKIGQYAENVYFGKPSGLLDQMGCALGGIATINFLSQENPVVTSVHFDFDSAGYALCIVDTGADHANLTEDYAAIPSEMKSIAKAFGKAVLSEVDENAFYDAIPKLRKELGDRAVMRAIHYYSDCRRVDQMVAALERNDFEAFLSLVSSSGRSSFMYLQNVDTYRNARNQPVALALAMADHLLDGSGAYRVHGGGFAGTIQAFVPLDMVSKFQAAMDNLLGAGACRVTCIRPVGGCLLLD